MSEKHDDPDVYYDGDQKRCAYCDCPIPLQPLSRPCHKCPGESISEWEDNNYE